MQRIGVSLGVSKRIRLSELVGLAQLAEELGYESIWVPETWGADAVSVLAVLARETQRIKIAAGILNIYSRSAALIAQTAATLQGLSQGRFILGLGASGPIVVQAWHGVPYRRPLGRTEDYVKIIRLALAGERVDYQLDDLMLTGFRLLNPPDSLVPIYVAALGTKNIRLAASVADGWLPIFAARGRMSPLLTLFESAVRSAGRELSSIDVASYIPALIGVGSETLLREQLAYYVGGMGTFYNEFVRHIGFEHDAEEIQHHWQRRDRRAAAAAVGERFLNACTVGGESSAARKALDEYRSEGVRLPILALPHGSSAANAAATLEGLAPIIRP